MRRLEPRLIIADEPTTALDVTIQAQILQLLGELKERVGMALLLITHDMGVVAESADRVAVMYAGRGMEEASVDDLFADPRHPYTAGLLGCQPSAPGNRGVNRLPSIGDGCPFANRCANVVDECLRRFPESSSAGAIPISFPGVSASGSASPGRRPWNRNSWFATTR